MHLIKSIFPPLRRSTLVQKHDYTEKAYSIFLFSLFLISIPWHEDNYLLKSIDNYYILSNFHHFLSSSFQKWTGIHHYLIHQDNTIEYTRNDRHFFSKHYPIGDDPIWLLIGVWNYKDETIVILETSEIIKIQKDIFKDFSRLGIAPTIRDLPCDSFCLHI